MPSLSSDNWKTQTSPYINRFIQPDTVIPDLSNPQAWNRYSYVLNDPLIYNDPSGHCWGIASGIRRLPGYDVACNNIQQAWRIVNHPKATTGQRALAGSYIGLEVTVHVVLVVSVAIISVEAVAGIACAATNCEGGGSTEPPQLQRGNDFHYGEGGGPDQLEKMYPDTEFDFAKRGEAGPDVRYKGGTHPSDYPDSTWDPENDYGDFKTDKPWSKSKFLREIRDEKLPPNTQPLPYDPDTNKLLPIHKFGGWME